MAGAVDLSGLKQRAQQTASADAAAAPSAAGWPWSYRDHRGQFRRTKCWSGPRKCRSWCCCGHRAATRVSSSSKSCPAWPPRTTASGRWRPSTSTWRPGWPRYSVSMRCPTVVALAAGQPLSSFQGMQPPDQLRRWVDSLLSATAGKLRGPSGSADAEEVDPELAAARQQLEAGDFEAAEGSYQAILDADPGSVEAKGAIRQIDFLTRATAQPPGRRGRRRCRAGRHRCRLRGRRRANPQPGRERARSSA